MRVPDPQPKASQVTERIRAALEKTPPWLGSAGAADESSSEEAVDAGSDEEACDEGSDEGSAEEACLLAEAEARWVQQVPRHSWVHPQLLWACWPARVGGHASVQGQVARRLGARWPTSHRLWRLRCRKRSAHGHAGARTRLSRPRTR